MVMVYTYMQKQKVKRVGGGFGVKGFLRAKNITQQHKRRKAIVPKPSYPQRLRSQKFKPIAKLRQQKQSKKEGKIALGKKKLAEKDESGQSQEQGRNVDPLRQQIGEIMNPDSAVLSLQIIQPEAITLTQNILENRIQFIQQITSPIKNDHSSLDNALISANQRYQQLASMYQALQRQYNLVNDQVHSSIQQSKKAQILYEQTITAFQMVNKSRQQLLQFNKRLKAQIEEVQKRPPRIQYVQVVGLRDEFNRLKYQYEQLQFKQAQQSELQSKYLALHNQYNNIRQSYERMKKQPKQTIIQYYPQLSTQRQLEQMRKQLNLLRNQPMQIQYVTDTQFEDKYFKLLKSHQKAIKQIQNSKSQKQQPKIKIKKVVDQQQIDQYNSLLQMFNQLKDAYEKVSNRPPQILRVPIPLQENQTHQQLIQNYNSLQRQYYHLRQQFVYLSNNPQIVTQFKTPEKIQVQKIVYKTPPQKIVFKTPAKKEPQKIYIEKWFDKEVVKYKTPQKIFIQKWKTPVQSQMIAQPEVQRVIQYVPQVQQVFVEGPQRIVQVPYQVKVPVYIQKPIYVDGPQRIVYKESQPIVFVDQQKITQLEQQKKIIKKHLSQLKQHHKQIIQQKIQLEELNQMIQQQYNEQIDNQTLQIQRLKQTIDQKQERFKLKQRQSYNRRMQYMKQISQFRKKMQNITAMNKLKKQKIKFVKAKQIFKRSPNVKRQHAVQWSPNIKNQQAVQWSTPRKSQISDDLSIERSPFHTPKDQDGIGSEFIDSQQQNEELDRDQSFNIESELRSNEQSQIVSQDNQSQVQVEDNDFGNDVQMHNIGSMSIVCCWQRNKDQLWIGTKIARPTGYAYYTHQSVKIPRDSVQYVYSTFAKMKAKDKDQNGKVYARVPHTKIYFIKDTYKHVQFIGLRRCIYYRKQLYPTRFGFNLLESQFTEAMNNWSQVLQQLDFQ